MLIMKSNRSEPKSVLQPETLPKCPTGIHGLDEITRGGFPKERSTLICGNAGCGKTLMAMEFLVKGATLYDEPGVFIAFEETEEELVANVRSLGFNIEKLVREKKMLIDHVHLERSEIEETGEYDLEGLFIRIKYAIDQIGAKRVVIDTIESLFAGLPNDGILRAELRRLFRWLKDNKVTSVITGERGDTALTRQGLEEYVSDCVILLDHHVSEQTSTRRLRILKYRGTLHGTNEYPFLIDESGISVLPITSLGLSHKVSSETISSGIADLDAMLGKKGYYRGSTILISGTAGTGKTSLGAHFVDATCKRGERVLYFSLEEAPDQIMRNMSSIGINLEPLVKNGTLLIHAMRPTFTGIEMHLSMMIKKISEFNPTAVVIDPLNSFVSFDNASQAKSLAMRLIDFLKIKQITALLTNLTSNSGLIEQSDIFISSLIDTWILLRDIELGGERNRGIYILKSRGMAHSNQIREFLITSNGIKLRKVYVGMSGVLTGSARIAQEAKDKTEEMLNREIIQQRKTALERRRKSIDAQISSLKAEFEAEKAEALKMISIEEARLSSIDKSKKDIALSRKSNGQD
jgi:circadian clock protein KaiC